MCNKEEVQFNNGSALKFSPIESDQIIRGLGHAPVVYDLVEVDGEYVYVLEPDTRQIKPEQ